LFFIPFTIRALSYFIFKKKKVGEDPTLSQPVMIDINSLLSGYQISSVLETQLTAVRKSDRPDAIDIKGISTRVPINVTLKSTEIRTFIITLKAASKYTFSILS